MNENAMTLSRLPPPLLAWYRASARDLPWRKTRDPYRIWVSEIMLQQTRVAAVLGYYARFLEAFCEAMWARMKEELLYGRYDTKKMAIEELKTLIWRYFMIYWNNRRICSVNGGLPPMLKRKQYYESLEKVA